MMTATLRTKATLECMLAAANDRHRAAQGYIAEVDAIMARASSLEAARQMVQFAMIEYRARLGNAERAYQARNAEIDATHFADESDE